MSYVLAPLKGKMPKYYIKKCYRSPCPNKRIFICLHTTSYYLDLHILCTFISLVFMNNLIRQVRSENLMLECGFFEFFFLHVLLRYVPSSYASEQISVHKFNIWMAIYLHELPHRVSRCHEVDLVNGKGQLISKGLFVFCFQFSQNTNEKYLLQ